MRASRGLKLITEHSRTARTDVTRRNAPLTPPNHLLFSRARTATSCCCYFFYIRKEERERESAHETRMGKKSIKFVSGGSKNDANCAVANSPFYCLMMHFIARSTLPSSMFACMRHGEV